MHKVFISYYHAEDQYYKDQLIKKFDNINFLDGSVHENEIDNNIDNPNRIHQIIRDEYLRDTSVTIVLLGKHTDWRKHIDWEIASSLRNTQYNKRSGLLGILLPEHPAYNGNLGINKNNTQRRFVDNYKIGYAPLIKWSEISSKLEEAIHKAYNLKKQCDPDNSEDLRRYNRNT